MVNKWCRVGRGGRWGNDDTRREVLRRDESGSVTVSVSVIRIRTKLPIRTKFTKKRQNYQKSFLMEVGYLRYILVVLAAECTMFTVRYYGHIT